MPISTFANSSGSARIQGVTIFGSLYADVRNDYGTIGDDDILGLRVMGDAVGPLTIAPLNGDNQIEVQGSASEVTIEAAGGGNVDVFNITVEEDATDSDWNLASIFGLVRVAGDFDGQMEVSEPLSTSETSPTPIAIGGSLTADGTIELTESDSLDRQIDIGYNNTDADPDVGEWKGLIKVGTLELEPVSAGLLNGQYAERSGDLGGGAIGRVPYRIHGTDADLLFGGANGTIGTGADDETYREANVDTQFHKDFHAVREDVRWDVRFYGRLNQVSLGSPPPFDILRRPIGGSTWQDITSVFSSSVAFQDNRTVRFTSGSPYSFWNGYEYRIEPNRSDTSPYPTILRCESEQTVKPSVAADAIAFCVGTQCPQDFNGDGVINSADLSVLLANFNTSITAGYVNGGDANGDNSANSADLSVILGTFSSTCDPCAEEGGESLLANEGPHVTGEQIIAMFGFSSIEAYTAWVDEMDETEFDNHVVVLEAVVHGLESGEQ